MVDLAKKDVASADSRPDLDALRLIRFVYARRILRGVVAAAVLGLVAWLLATTLLAKVLPTGSVLREPLTQHTGLGYLLLLVAAVVALVALWVIHYVGPEARFAALVRPVLFGEKNVQITGNRTVADSTHARIRRRGYVRVVAVIGIPLAAAGVAATASLFVPSIRGTFGDGGPVLTVGRDTEVVDVRTSTTYSGKSHSTHKTYIVSTAEGRTAVAGGRPEKGDKVVLVHDLFGGRSAVLVHGTAALETGVALVVFAAILAGLVLWQYTAVRTERRARQRTGDPSLAEDLAAMRGGATFELRVGEVRRSVGVRAPAARVRDVDRRRRLWLVAGGAGLVVLVGVPVLVVALRSGSDARPQDRAARRVSLAYLAAAGWAPGVYVVYDHPDVTRAVAVDQLEAGGVTAPRVGASWSMVVSSADRPVTVPPTSGSSSTDPRARTTLAAALDVSATDADPRSAAAGLVAHARSLAASYRQRTSEVVGLPAGWVGVVTTATSARTARVEVGVAASGYLVDIEIELPDDSPRLTSAEVTSRAQRLAGAIAARGVPALVAATR